LGSHNSGGVVQEDHLMVLFTPVNADVHLNGGLDAGELPGVSGPAPSGDATEGQMRSVPVQRDLRRVPRPRAGADRGLHGGRPHLLHRHGPGTVARRHLTDRLIGLKYPHTKTQSSAVSGQGLGVRKNGLPPDGNYLPGGPLGKRHQRYGEGMPPAAQAARPAFAG